VEKENRQLCTPFFPNAHVQQFSACDLSVAWRKTPDDRKMNAKPRKKGVDEYLAAYYISLRNSCAMNFSDEFCEFYKKMSARGRPYQEAVWREFLFSVLPTGKKIHIC
jgi:hypothetical protein